MKRVYVVFESMSDFHSLPEDWNYAATNYEDEFIEVYDNFPAAVKSIREWALAETAEDDVTYRRSDKSSEEFCIIDKSSPYSNEDKIWKKRVVKSTLLKSS